MEIKDNIIDISSILRRIRFLEKLFLILDTFWILSFVVLVLVCWVSLLYGLISTKLGVVFIIFLSVWILLSWIRNLYTRDEE